MYRVYKTNLEIECKHGRLTLEQKQKIVGGLIELIGEIWVQGVRYSFYANEEGLLMDLEWNPFFPGIKGNVLFCNEGDD